MEAIKWPQTLHINISIRSTEAKQQLVAEHIGAGTIVWCRIVLFPTPEMHAGNRVVVPDGNFPSWMQSAPRVHQPAKLGR